VNANGARATLTASQAENIRIHPILLIVNAKIAVLAVDTARGLRSHTARYRAA
jgi:hypothetical protein